MPRPIKQFIMETLLGAPKARIQASLGLKFMSAVIIVIALLMLTGTFFVTRLLVNYQYASVEARGRETGTVLGKAIIDKLIAGDHIGLNILVEDVVKSSDMIWVIIKSTDGIPITSARASFAREDAGVKAVITNEKTDSALKLVAAVRQKLEPIEVLVDISLEGTKLGVVHMAFSREPVKVTTRKIVILLFGTGFMIIVVLSSVVFIMVGRMIVIPTKAAEAAAIKISAGDLSQSVRVQSVDELGMLGRGLNRMIIGLKTMVQSVRDGADKNETVWKEVKSIAAEINGGSTVQAESVEEASSSVNEMHFSLKEIAGNVQELYTSSENTSSSVIEMAASISEVATTMGTLAASIEETSTAIAQLSAAVRQIAENVEVLQTAAEETAASTMEISASVQEVESNAKASAALAEAVASDAQELGMRSVEKNIAGMNRIEQTARRTAESVNRLGERAESIGGILTVIEDITDQTSLLALNAAILAAQAGEHGKGFAVVAAEIRELASRTAASTQEIGKLINAVQDESREAVKVMQEEVVMVEEGVLLAHDAGEALMKILERADQARTMSKGINKAATEQARGIQQVRNAVEKINDMTHQIARAVNEQKLGSEQITRAAEKMRDLTRFVRNSTEEQARGSKEITVAVEEMSTKVGFVNRAAGEVQSGSDLIVKSIERIREIARSNAELAAGLNVAMDVMVKQNESLSNELGKFKT